MRTSSFRTGTTGIKGRGQTRNRKRKGPDDRPCTSSWIRIKIRRVRPKSACSWGRWKSFAARQGAVMSSKGGCNCAFQGRFLPPCIADQQLPEDVHRLYQRGKPRLENANPRYPSQIIHTRRRSSVSVHFNTALSLCLLFIPSLIQKNRAHSCSTPTPYTSTERCTGRDGLDTRHRRWATTTRESERD